VGIFKAGVGLGRIIGASDDAAVGAVTLELGTIEGAWVGTHTQRE
jgi:hypothetical protein